MSWPVLMAFERDILRKMGRSSFYCKNFSCTWLRNPDVKTALCAVTASYLLRSLLLKVKAKQTGNKIALLNFAAIFVFIKKALHSHAGPENTH